MVVNPFCIGIMVYQTIGVSFNIGYISSPWDIFKLIRPIMTTIILVVSMI